MRARGWTPATWYSIDEAQRHELLAFELERERRKDERRGIALDHMKAWETETGVLARILVGLLME